MFLLLYSGVFLHNLLPMLQCLYFVRKISAAPPPPTSTVPPNSTPLIMTTINVLSYEILIDIFCLLTTADVGSVSRVSQRWHEICEPVLYREPHLSDCAHIPTAIELFLRTVLAPGCERLASYVRVLDVQWLDVPVNPIPERQSITDIITAEISRIGVTNICLPGSQSSPVMLLMLRLPRLQRLVLQYGGHELCNDIMPGIGPSEAFPLAFLSLTEFSYETPYLSLGVSAKALLFLLQLPHLRTLSVDVIDNIHPELFAGAGGTSGVTKLTLGYCTVSAATLSLILRVPRALEYFSYQGDCVKGFMDVLFPLRASLMHLHLDFGTEYDPEQMLNLREWPVFQSLRCSSAVLLRDKVGDRTEGRSLAEVLPISIRRLALLDYCDDYPWWDFGQTEADVVQLLGQKWMVPALERLVVEIGSILDRARLRVACEDAGVVLEDDCSSW